jgi:hypothetical protein
VRRKVEVEATIVIWKNKRTEQLVRLFIRPVRRDPAEAPGHAKQMGVYWECGQSRTTVYGSWLSCLEVWSDRWGRLIHRSRKS